MKLPPKIYPNTIEEQRREMVRVARGIIDGSIGIVDGARQLTALRFSSQAEKDQDILVFCRIDSETGHMPIGNVRHNWDPSVLKEKDKELQNYEALVRDQAMQAAQNIVAKYAN